MSHVVIQLQKTLGGVVGVRKSAAPHSQLHAKAYAAKVCCLSTLRVSVLCTELLMQQFILASLASTEPEDACPSTIECCR